MFDDCYGIPDDPAERAKLALFTHEMADRILRFADDGALPLLVHCTEGVSRAGAVGAVLNEYFNPDHYRPELPSSNRSHKGEDVTDEYFGD